MRTAEEAITRYVSDTVCRPESGGQMTGSFEFMILNLVQVIEQTSCRVERGASSFLWQRAGDISIALQLVPLPSGLTLFRSVLVTGSLTFFLESFKALLSRFSAGPAPIFHFSHVIFPELIPTQILLRLLPRPYFPWLRLNVLGWR